MKAKPKGKVKGERDEVERVDAGQRNFDGIHGVTSLPFDPFVLFFAQFPE